MFEKLFESPLLSVMAGITAGILFMYGYLGYLWLRVKWSEDHAKE